VVPYLFVQNYDVNGIVCTILCMVPYQTFFFWLLPTRYPKPEPWTYRTHALLRHQ